LIGVLSLSWHYDKPFIVSLTANIKDAPMNSEPFEFGIVQNKVGGAWKAVYDDGSIVWNTPGPLLDVRANVDPVFIGKNAVFPTASLGPIPQVTPTFNDSAGGDTPLAKRLHCNKWANLISFERSNVFRAGLVARGIRSNRLVQLGAIAGSYSSTLTLTFSNTHSTYSYKSVDADNLNGAYPLSATAPQLTLTGSSANDADLTGITAAKAAYDQNCGPKS
jgi:hypothetical protein